ncbi:MAG: hypothetical protein WAW59_01830 [Patescibacteria group bacterium]
MSPIAVVRFELVLARLPESVRRFELVVERRPERVVMLEVLVAMLAVFPATTPESEVRLVQRVPTVEVRVTRLPESVRRFELVEASPPERVEISEKSVEISVVTPESELLMVAIVPESAFCARASVK